MRLLPPHVALAAAVLSTSAGHSQTADIKHFWDFETGYDDGVGSANGIAGAEVSTATGHDGGTACFTPSALPGDVVFDEPGYVDIDPAITSIGDGTTPFAFSYWVRLDFDDTTNPRGIFDFSGDGGDGPQSLFIQADNANKDMMAFRVDGAGFAVAFADVSAFEGTAESPEGTWFFVVANFDPSGALAIHINGEAVPVATASAGGVGTVNWDPDQYLGAFNVNPAKPTSINRGLLGAIDDMAVYSGLLTTDQIAGLYAGTTAPTDIVFVPEPSAPVGHYWDFDTLDAVDFLPEDRFGDFNLADAPGGFADFGPNAVYGEAFSGSGNTLNIELGDFNYMVADTFDESNGVPLALDFGTNDFAISYWVWDSSDEVDGDADPRTACVLDCLSGTETGVQISTTAEGFFNLRLDDDAGNEFVSGPNALVMPADQWVQVTVNVDRSANLASVYFDGALAGSYDISALTGSIYGTQDLQLGVINGGNSAAQAQRCGLDEIAIYPRTLGAEEIAALAAATTDPLTVLNTVPAGAPELVAYSRDPGTGESTIVWGSEVGVTYSVWGSPDLQVWTELTAPGGVEGDGSNQSFMHTPAGPPAAYFYRVSGD